MYYKIASLAETGKKIILHYFNYNNRSISSLQKYCYQVHSYNRLKGFKALSFTKPYIVSSRMNNELIQRLNKDDHPVLLEGLHCTGILPFLNKNKKTVIRIHNNESVYYAHLANTEKNLLKHFYYLWEAKVLKKYQEALQKKLPLACLSELDLESFKDEGFQSLHFIPCFTPWQRIKIKKGKGAYCLYHGNMEVAENEAAAKWLIENVFNAINTSFIISGNGISNRLMAYAKEHSHIQFINNPSIEQLNNLVSDAHINILPSMNQTGVKLKLLHALAEGRFCITNQNGLAGSKIITGITSAETPSSWISHIKKMMMEEFDDFLIEERTGIFALYNNQKNAEKLNELLKHYQ